MESNSDGLQLEWELDGDTACSGKVEETFSGPWSSSMELGDSAKAICDIVPKLSSPQHNNSLALMTISLPYVFNKASGMPYFEASGMSGVHDQRLRSLVVFVAQRRQFKKSSVAWGKQAR